GVGAQPQVRNEDARRVVAGVTDAQAVGDRADRLLPGPAVRPLAADVAVAAHHLAAAIQRHHAGRGQWARHPACRWRRLGRAGLWAVQLAEPDALEAVPGGPFGDVVGDLSAPGRDTLGGTAVLVGSASSVGDGLGVAAVGLAGLAGVGGAASSE